MIFSRLNKQILFFMVEMKPDEISAILRQQLSNFNATDDLEEVGTVLQVCLLYTSRCV